ncbi:hypothetical protein REH81_12055 [Vibrio rotiferianus]
MADNTATIYEVYDANGEDVVGYGVELKGLCADEFGLDRDEDFDNEVDAHAFAEQCKVECGASIQWDCIKPAWA